MAEIKPPHALVIDCPPSRNDGGGGGRRRQPVTWRNASAGEKACAAALLIVLGAAALITGGLTFLAIFLDQPSKDPVYTVAITDVTGMDYLALDPAWQWDVVDAPPPADYDDCYSSSSSSPPPPPPPTALSPVFSLTFQIDNTRNAFNEACAPGLSRADVSYGDAFLAGGSVPPFCAGTKRRSDGVAVRAWGENVAVPRFLRDQLAAELAEGDASVDVKVTMPTVCRGDPCGGSAGAVLSCKAKIGGGASPACRLDYL